MDESRIEDLMETSRDNDILPKKRTVQKTNNLAQQQNTQTSIQPIGKFKRKKIKLTVKKVEDLDKNVKANEVLKKQLAEIIFKMSEKL